MIGLVGAQGTGKTTLAKTFAEQTGGHYLDASVTRIIREAGYDPVAAGLYDFTARLTLQEIVLDRVQELYAAAPTGLGVITDRTPIDMLGYTMAEAIGASVPEWEQERFARYIENCFRAINGWFAMVVLVQPGIPVAQGRDGKAVSNKAFIEHLNSLCLGLTVDPRIECAHFYLPRSMLDLDERVRALEGACGRTVQTVMSQAAYMGALGSVH